MTIDYPAILDSKTEGLRGGWTEFEPMLYALGIGMGADPLDPHELRFVYERDLRVVPTFATIVTRPAIPRGLELIDTLQLDGERRLILHRPLPRAAQVVMDGRIVDVIDRGARGTVLISQVDMFAKADRQPIATIRTSIFAPHLREFGRPGSAADGGVSADRPDRAPDLRVDFPTRADQALLYRLSGDRNPLHCDPEVAARDHYDRPILHGLCSFGICARAILQSYADYDPAAITSIGAKFTSPIFPGERIAVDLWRDGNVIAFEAHVPARGVTAIKYGRATLA